MSLRLLVVDDDHLILSSVMRSLGSLGWDITISNKPTTAANDWEGNAYDAILIDWVPHGPEMLDRCGVAGTPAEKVVIYTGQGPSSLRGDERITTKIQIVSKPFKTEELHTALYFAATGRLPGEGT